MLVDGMALLFRSFYATATSGYYMVNSKGIPTNAIYGFIKHLFTAINTYHPTHVICCWDMGSSTFRTELYAKYKANRSEPPAEILPQFELVKEVVEELNIPNIGLEGYEADDCIGTLVRNYERQSDVFVLTVDQDFLQLLADGITVILLGKGYGHYIEYSEETFYAEKGLSPLQLIDLKALMGDRSDNYPGVKGIGEKTALSLLQSYETVEGILENLQKLTESQRNKIERDLHMLHVSRQLATIDCSVPVSCSLDNAVLNIDVVKMKKIFRELEFKNLEKMIRLNRTEYDGDIVL